MRRRFVPSIDHLTQRITPSDLISVGVTAPPQVAQDPPDLPPADEPGDPPPLLPPTQEYIDNILYPEGKPHQPGTVEGVVSTITTTVGTGIYSAYWQYISGGWIK